MERTNLFPEINSRHVTLPSWEPPTCRLLLRIPIFFLTVINHVQICILSHFKQLHHRIKYDYVSVVLGHKYFLNILVYSSTDECWILTMLRANEKKMLSFLITGVRGSSCEVFYDTFRYCCCSVSKLPFIQIILTRFIYPSSTING